MLDLNLVRSASLWLCAVVLLLTFGAVLWTHWRHRRQAHSHFHASAVSEMTWSLMPALMVLCLVGVAFKDFWLV
jgi:heme/copper-type cytochrome/quinol oxidase subunit 2